MNYIIYFLAVIGIYSILRCLVNLGLFLREEFETIRQQGAIYRRRMDGKSYLNQIRKGDAQ